MDYSIKITVFQYSINFILDFSLIDFDLTFVVNLYLK